LISNIGILAHEPIVEASASCGKMITSIKEDLQGEHGFHRVNILLGGLFHFIYQEPIG
jgi:hypothetical protein